MRRLDVPTHRALQCVLIAMLALCTSMPAMAGTESAEATPDSSPPAAEVIVMGIVTIPDPTNPAVKTILYLSQVTLPTHSVVEEHTHEEQSVLTVNDGAICFTVGGKEEDTVVTFTRQPDTTIHPNCAETPDLITGCADLDSGIRQCNLEEGATVYLPQGSSVTQNGDILHNYENVDDMPAVVYIAGYMPDSGDDVGCDGSCK